MADENYSAIAAANQVRQLNVKHVIDTWHARTHQLRNQTRGLSSNSMYAGIAITDLSDFRPRPRSVTTIDSSRHNCPPWSEPGDPRSHVGVTGGFSAFYRVIL